MLALSLCLSLTWRVASVGWFLSKGAQAGARTPNYLDTKHEKMEGVLFYIGGPFL